MRVIQQCVQSQYSPIGGDVQQTTHFALSPTETIPRRRNDDLTRQGPVHWLEQSDARRTSERGHC